MEGCRGRSKSTVANFGISAISIWLLTRFRATIRHRIAGMECEPMAWIKLRYVNEYLDRHGKVRRYFRRPGSRGVKLPGPVGSIEFMDAYKTALAAVAPPPPSSKHVIHGSLAEIS